MLLRALQDIPCSVSAIRKDKPFIEPNDERREEWLRTGVAEPWNKTQPGPIIGERGPEIVTLPRGPQWDGPDWKGQTVVVIASGPSVTAEQCERVRVWRNAESQERKVAVINTTFRIAPWADLLYACDLRWWDCVENGKTHFEEANETFALNEMWTTEEPAARKYGIRYIKSQRSAGLGKTHGLIHQGNNGGYQAVNFAYQAGAKRIILLGFDMRDVDGKAHHHPDHPGIRTVNDYQTWIREFEVMAPELKAEGVEVVNSTPGSALKCFERVGLARALRGNDKAKDDNGSGNALDVVSVYGQARYIGSEGEVEYLRSAGAQDKATNS